MADLDALKNVVFTESYWKLSEGPSFAEGEVESVGVIVQVPVATRLNFAPDVVGQEQTLKPIANFMKRRALTALIQKLQECLDTIPNG